MDDIEFYEQQLATARREGNREMMGTYLGSLGNMYALQGNIRRGIECLEEARQIRESLHDWDGVALTCKNLAGCYELGLGDLAIAVKYLEIAANVATPSNPEKEVYAAMGASRREELESKTRMSTELISPTEQYMTERWKERFDELYELAEVMMPLIEQLDEDSFPFDEDSKEFQRAWTVIQEAELLLAKSSSSQVPTMGDLVKFEWLIDEFKWLREALESK